MSSGLDVQIADGVAVVTIANGKVNALPNAVQDEIAETFRRLGTYDSVRAIVLTGSERAFAAGADVAEFRDATAEEMATRAHVMQRNWEVVATCPKPVVAAIAGPALGGGCELAMCADRRIATPTAFLGQPEILLGLVPGIGGTQRLTRLVGPAKAKDIVFTGRRVPAEEALAIGLVDEIVEPGDLLRRAHEWAAQFAHGAAVALAAAKRLIDHGGSLADGLVAESVAFAAMFTTEDRTTGTRSFFDNGVGKARFAGR